MFWYARDDRKLTEIYDIDGTCYGPDFDILARDENKFSGMTGDWIVKLYAAQQAGTRTSSSQP